MLSKPHMRDHTATSMLNAIRAAFTRVSSPAANSTAQTDSASADAVANETGSGKPRKRVFSQFHPFRSMEPSQRKQRRLALCPWSHTVRTGHRTARRDDPAGRWLERHSELWAGGSVGVTTRLLYYRSRELIPVTYAVVAEAHQRQKQIPM